MKKLFILFAAIAAFASCAKENPSTTTEGRIVTLQALAPARENTEPSAASANLPQTKTQLVDGTNVKWTPGDVVKLCFLPKAYSDHTNSTKYGYNTNFTYSGTELSEAASFQGTWGPAKANLLNTDGFVVYPGNSDNFTFSAQTDDYAAVSFTIAYNLPTEQEAIEGSFDNGLNLSYALISSTDVENNNAKVQFKNLCAIFRINLPETEHNIKSIKLEPESNTSNYYMTGLKEFDLTPNKLQGKDYSSASKPAYVTLRKSDGSNLKAGATYYAVVWGENHYYNGIKITFTNDKGEECVKVAGSGTWISCEPGTCKTFNISSLSFKKNIEIGHYYYSDGTTGEHYKNNAVGLVFYVGDPHEIDSSLPDQWKTGLVVGLEEFSNLTFGTNSKGNTSGLHPDSYGVNTYASDKYQANSILDAASKDIMSISYAHAMTLKHRKQEGGSQLYSSYGLGSKTAYGSGWLIPSAKEYSLMYKNIDILNSKAGFTKLKVWTSSEKQQNDSSHGEWVIGYHTVWQANIDGENGWRCLNYYYIDHSTEGIAQVVTNTNSQSGSKGHIGRAFFAF